MGVKESRATRYIAFGVGSVIILTWPYIVFDVVYEWFLRHGIRLPWAVIVVLVILPFVASLFLVPWVLLRAEDRSEK
jgi:hypothetical protein